MRNITFTSFEENAPDFNETYYRYMIYGEEICPESGKKHWQGYIELGCQLTFNQVKNILPKEYHFEVAKGDVTANRAYCSKDGKYKEFGSPKSQGERNDLKRVNNYILNDNAKMSEVAMAYPNQFMKYHAGIGKLIEMREKATCKSRDVEVHVLVGPTRCGKTRFVYEESEDLYDLICEKGETLWFDGYEGETDLLLDEFRGGCDYAVLLRLLDRYPMRLRVKGGHTYAKWNRVYITSNLRPEAWFEHKDISALKARFTSVKDFYAEEEEKPMVPHVPKSLCKKGP